MKEKPGDSRKPTENTKIYKLASKITDKLENMYNNIID
jgi:hypothetical protein